MWYLGGFGVQAVAAQSTMTGNQWSLFARYAGLYYLTNHSICLFVGAVWLGGLAAWWTPA